MSYSQTQKIEQVDERIRQATLRSLRQFIEELKREQQTQILQLQATAGSDKA